MSRTEFRRLSTTAAGGLLATTFAPILKAVTAVPSVQDETGLPVVRYTSDYTALVAGPRGLQTAYATAPIAAVRRGIEAPVDLALEPSASGYVPRNAPSRVTIGTRLSDGAALGSSGIRLSMVGADVPAHLQSGQSVFYHEVGRDTDASVVPTTSGVEMFAVLRGTDSPELLRYHVAAPAGTALSIVDGAIQVVRDGRAIAVIPPPSAVDAQREPVPVTMTLAGHDALLRVAHRGLDRAYPILVDPLLEVGSASAPGWSFHKGIVPALNEPAGYKESSSGPFVANFVGYIKAKKGETFSVKAGAWWKWEVPSNVTLATVYFNNTMVFEPRTITSNEWNGAIAAVEPSGETCAAEYVGIERGKGFFNLATCANAVNGLYLALRFRTSGTEKAEHGINMQYYAIFVTQNTGVPKGPRYAEGNPAEPNTQTVSCGRPVNCATGNQYETQPDIAIPGYGAGLNLVRTYNSQLAVSQTSPGRFGYGWSDPFGANLTFEEVCNKAAECVKAATVHQANGSTITFENYGTTWYAEGPWVEATFVKQSDGTYLYTLPNQTTMHFDATGRLLSETDRNGNAISLTYTESRVSAVADGTGRSIKFAYNTDGTVKEATGPLGTVLYGYTSGNLTQVTDLDKHVWKYEYDAAHQLKVATDPLKHTVTTEYDTSHRVISQTDPLKRITKWKYATAGSGTETTVTDPNGSINVMLFNATGQPTSITHASGTSVASTTTYAYNTAQELVSKTDPNKHTTHYLYNSAGDRTSETDALEHTTEWTYNETHDVLTTTTPDGEKTTITRDAHGNAEIVSRPAPGETVQTTTYKYDSHGDRESTTDPLKRTWTYEYDTHGDRTAEIDPEGDKRTWAYNEGSQPTSSVSPRGNVTGGEPAKYTTKYEADALGHLLSTTDPLGHVTKYTYDAAYNLETRTDPNGHVTKYTYDEDNERTKVESATKAITETTYDSDGQIKSQIDGDKHVTEYVHNAAEQTTEVIDPLKRKTVKEYDPAGNLKTLTDPAKRTTSYTYDAANRLKEVSYSDGKTPTAKYEYNGDGLRTHMTDGSGETRYAYDQLDRLTEAENGHKETIAYEDDLANEQTKITYPNGKSVTRSYDKAARLEKITDWLEQTTKYTYNPDSESSAIIFPAGTTDEDTYAYNEADQMTEAKMKKGAEVLASLVYARDNASQVKGITSKGLPGEESLSYEYDSNNRLLKGATTSYEYDAADNPKKEGTSAYTYDGASQLETGPSLKYTYNEEGQRTKSSPTTGAATTYENDQAGNLTAITRPKEGEIPAIEDKYMYDATGLRASQMIAGTTTYLVWDTSQAEPLLLSDGTNSYIYGSSNTPVEQINSEGKAVYLHQDQQGSTRMLTGTTGNVEATMTYDAYGNTTGTTGSAKTPMGYDGQYTSSDTGLIYLRARTYEPKTAQFLSADPIAQITRAPYNYTNDNPVNFTDPSGLCGFSSFGDFADCLERAATVLSKSSPTLGITAEIAQWAIHHPGQAVEYAAIGTCVLAAPEICLGASAFAWTVNTSLNVAGPCGFSFAKEGLITGEALLGAAPGLGLQIPQLLGKAAESGPVVNAFLAGPGAAVTLAEPQIERGVLGKP